MKWLFTLHFVVCEVVEKVREERPLTVILEEDDERLDLLTEAIAGMRVGGRRRVLLPPSSRYSLKEDDTIEFDIEVSGIKTGRDGHMFRLRRAVGSKHPRTMLQDIGHRGPCAGKG